MLEALLEKAVGLSNLDVSRRFELFSSVDFGRQESAKLQLPLLESLSEPLAPDGPHPFPQTLSPVDLQSLSLTFFCPNYRKSRFAHFCRNFPKNIEIPTKH